MKRLSKMFLAVLLLTAASVSSAACPEGTKNNYKGECVDASGKLLPKYLQHFSNPTKVVLVDKEDDGYGDFGEFEYGPGNPGTPYAVAVVNAPDHPVRFGEQSIRFELQPGDCGGTDCETDRERSERTARRQDKSGQEYWYAWSVHFKDYINIRPPAATYGQWFQYTKKWWKPEEQKWETQSDHDLVNVMMRDKRLMAALSKDFDNERVYLLIPASEVSNQWHDLVLNIKWSGGSNGFIRI